MIWEATGRPAAFASGSPFGPGSCAGAEDDSGGNRAGKNDFVATSLVNVPGGSMIILVEVFSAVITVDCRMDCVLNCSVNVVLVDGAEDIAVEFPVCPEDGIKYCLRLDLTGLMVDGVLGIVTAGVPIPSVMEVG